MAKNGGINFSVDDAEKEFALLVADIVAAKLAGNYENIEAEIVGGWYISPENQQIQRAEVIADAVVEEIGVKA